MAAGNNKQVPIQQSANLAKPSANYDAPIHNWKKDEEKKRKRRGFSFGNHVLMGQSTPSGRQQGTFSPASSDGDSALALLTMSCPSAQGLSAARVL